MPEEGPELRTETERDVEPPESERESRPDTDLRENWDRDERADRDDERELDRELLLFDPLPPPVMPVGGEDTMPVGETTGARPQVSQYSSPPPTSS
ncbi:hypothetical protein [Streptomyces longisporoflavus]|uniref:hypothetical protein n=1 Tax=Streptomyces longisporoflavus TaxID=28044 RepID=UPI00403294EC